MALPPRVLATCNWPSGDDGLVFVTENPSVFGAAADIPGARIVCTSGTPSRIEVEALARLARQGWRLRVRADFDRKWLTTLAANARSRTAGGLKLQALGAMVRP